MNFFKSTLSLIGLFLIFSLVPAKLSFAQNNDNSFRAVENMPELHGSLDSLQKQIDYPDEALDKKVEGTVIVQLIVNKKGQAESPRVLRGIGAGCDKEALRVVKKAQFSPGVQRGQKVRVQYTVPVKFEIKIPPQSEQPSGDVLMTAEQMPQLKGGMDRIMEEIEYPEMARKASVEGRVVVRAIIEKDGSISSPEVIRGIGGGCDKEALRVVEELSFEPGRHNGKPVRVQYSIVVPFRLQN